MQHRLATATAERKLGIDGSHRADGPRAVALHATPELIRPLETVYVPGASGAPSAFMSALLSEPAVTQNARLLTTYVPGINSFDLGRLHPTALASGLFMQPSFAEAQREGRFRTLPMSYAGFVRHIRTVIDIDLTVVQVSPPDASGWCSLGPAVEFTPLALQKSRRRLALINPRTPRVPGSVNVPYRSFDYVCEVDSPLPVYGDSPDSPNESIARHVSALIDDGCTLQFGLGKVPMALTRLLRDRRHLRLHSGMLSDGLLDLAEAGALDMDYLHTTCVVVGSAALYQNLPDFSPLRITSCDVTHAPQTLMGLQNFISINSALEVDLFGQCNLEHANGAAVSGAGGAPDFARAGRVSDTGRCIVALPSRHRHGSRIVPQLGAPGVASLSRIDVDFIVTEFGVARLTDASVYERAEAIIEVAAPEVRGQLCEAWRSIAARL